MGYTDMVRESAREVLENYGLDDNYTLDGRNASVFGVPWQTLVRALVKAIGPKRFLYNTPVIGITDALDGTREQCLKIVRTPFGPLAARNVIVATTLPSLIKLFPRVREYRMLQSQPFLRVYAKFPVNMRHILATTVTSYTIVRPPLQTIIPMDVAKGVYMIAYCDNAYSNHLNPFTSNTAGHCAYFARLVEKALGLPKKTLFISNIRAKYWDVGTHFVKPGGGLDRPEGAAAFFQKCQRPMPGVQVVGEVVAQHHRGWVEGALESVDSAMV